MSQEWEQTRLRRHELVERSTPTPRRRRSAGTRWTKRPLLYMASGCLVVRCLLPLLRGFGRLPLTCSRGLSAVLHAVRRPYHLINYVGSCAGGAVLSPRLMAALLDRTRGALRANLEPENAETSALRMAFPAWWGLYFTSTMLHQHHERP